MAGRRKVGLQPRIVNRLGGHQSAWRVDRGRNILQGADENFVRHSARRWTRRIRTKRPLMSRKLELTFACGDYEIMRALKEGIVRPEGIELTVLTDMAPSPRHWRFPRRRGVPAAGGSGSA